MNDEFGFLRGFGWVVFAVWVIVMGELWRISRGRRRRERETSWAAVKRRNTR